MTEWKKIGKLGHSAKNSMTPERGVAIDKIKRAAYQRRYQQKIRAGYRARRMRSQAHVNLVWISFALGVRAGDERCISRAEWRRLVRRLINPPE
jgi:hypothetical protein